MQGYGTNYYGPAESYEGEWYRDWRSGWGRMYYTDGSVYEGEWYDDKRQGKGLLRLGERLVLWHHCEHIPMPLSDSWLRDKIFEWREKVTHAFLCVVKRRVYGYCVNMM